MPTQWRYSSIFGEVNIIRQSEAGLVDFTRAHISSGRHARRVRRNFDTIDSGGIKSKCHTGKRYPSRNSRDMATPRLLASETTTVIMK